jgi:hypothetical protein
MSMENASVESLKKMLAKQEADLAEYLDWRKNKPEGVWMHRSAGTWARNAIKTIKAELKRR